MFAGHFGVALGLKKAKKELNIGWIFLFAMLSDILLGIFVLLGVEKATMPDNSQLHYLLFDFPFSHGLLATLIWSVIIVGITTLANYKNKDFKTVIILVIAFVSHFVLDLIVHIPEIPVFDSDSIKIGFGLWNHYLASMVLEISIVLVGLIIYLGVKKNLKSKIGFIIFSIVVCSFVVMQFFSTMTDKSLIPFIASQWIVSGVLFSGIGYWLDLKL